MGVLKMELIKFEKMEISDSSSDESEPNENRRFKVHCTTNPGLETKFANDLLKQFARHISSVRGRGETIVQFGYENHELIFDALYPVISDYLDVLVLADPSASEEQPIFFKWDRCESKLLSRKISIPGNSVPEDLENRCHKIFSFFVLENYLPKEWAQQFKRLLAPRGKIFIALHLSNLIEDIMRVTCEREKWSQIFEPRVPGSYIHCEDPVQWIKEELQDEMHIEVCEVGNEILQFNTYDSFRDYVTSVKSCEEMCKEFTNDMMETLRQIARTAAVPSNYILNFSYLFLVATDKRKI